MKILAMILAGGENARRRLSNGARPKFALPFAHGCRIGDFVLGDLAPPIHIPTRYSSGFLITQIEPSRVLTLG